MAAGFTFRNYLDFFPVDNDGFIFSGYLARVAAINAIPLKQVGIGLGVREVVDSYDFNIILMALEDRP